MRNPRPRPIAAGIPNAAALRSATIDDTRALHVDDRLGSIPEIVTTTYDPTGAA